jgi:CheY-like chemotaxis protein
MNIQGKITYNTKSEEKIVVGNIVPAIEDGTHFKPLKILIVEDDEFSEKYIAIRIKKFCKEINTARTGVEAVEVCQNNPDIDLVLMDILMPEMNGYEATRQIRQFNKDLVIIAQTAYALYGDREKALEAGCNDYISKPILKDEFQALIQKYFK